MAAFPLAMVVLLALTPVTLAAPPPVLKAAPSTVTFGTRPVGSETLRAARLTNRSDATINLLVTAERMPDDFSFGLLPGSTCPVLEPAPLAPRESCDAVVQFRPTDFFAGDQQTATLLATATDPATGSVVATTQIGFTGTGR